MPEIIEQYYAPLLKGHGFIPDPDNQQYGSLGISWKLSPEIGEGFYWTYGQKDLYDIKIHNFSFHEDSLLEFSLPECLSITRYDSISGEELAPYRRLSAGCNLIHPTLELAVDDDYIRKNPSKGVYRSLKTEGAGAPPKKRIALTMTQQKNFLRFISKSPMYSHWLPVMVVLLGTGMRVAECTGLTKNDVDLENNTISVNHNLIYRVIDGKAGFHINTPKTTNGTRTIPILYPQVAEQLRTLIEVMDTLYPEDLVMNGYHGFLFRNREGYFLSAHNINRAIQRISIAYNAEEMDQAELEDREPELLPHFSVHNMRHTFCTRLCESTNDIKFIQQVMGHADFSTTMDIYTHITQENMREKAEAIKGNLVLM